MSKRIFVKPTNPEVKVVDPQSGRPIAKDGQDVTRSSYWLRRESDGDVEVGEARESEGTKASAKAKKAAK